MKFRFCVLFLGFSSFYIYNLLILLCFFILTFCILITSTEDFSLVFKVLAVSSGVLGFRFYVLSVSTKLLLFGRGLFIVGFDFSLCKLSFGNYYG